MASLDDLLTTAKNIVTAINGLNTTFMRSLGSTTSATITGSATLVIVGSGRLVNFSVVVVGSSDGAIYNTNNAANGTVANQLVDIPQTLGVFKVGQAFNSGLVIAPGSSQSVNVTYYLG